MPLKRRPLSRDNGVVRDASLIIVACEDTYAPRQYFARFRTRRVQFLILPPVENRSAPEHVLARLDEYKARTATEENDQFWLCIDTDRWAEPNHIHNLVQVLQQCRSKGYRIAMSNPCFDLWLLLHFIDLPTEPPIATCKDVADHMNATCGTSRKDCCDRLPITAEMVRSAIERSKSIDTAGEIPATIVTRVYLILEELLSRELIEFV